MDIDDVLLDAEERFEKCTTDYDAHLKSVRSGQASPEAIEHIFVEIPAYGTASSLKGLAVIARADARMLTVRPFDNKTLKDIEKAISAANLGLVLNNDGKILRVSFPPMSEENRKKQVKVIKERLEQHKVTVRNVRHESLKLLKGMEKSAGHSEDQVRKAEEEVNALTKRFEAALEAQYEKKSKELMTV